MSVEENLKLNEYKKLIEIIARVEYQKFSTTALVDLPELINIGTHALYILFKNKSPEHYNSAYLSTAIKWAIRNEVRRRYKWYSLKNKQSDEADETEEAEFRADMYKNILSIDELQDAEIPTQFKTDFKSPEENIEFTELKAGIIEAVKKLPQRERELIECKFFKEKKLREIADEFDISQSRISRIIQSGLDKIKKDLAKQGII